MADHPDVAFIPARLRRVEVFCEFYYNINVNRTKHRFTDNEEGEIMAVLAKPINKMTIIKEADFKEFVREFNKNKASKEFLELCKKAGKLFGRRK